MDIANNNLRHILPSSKSGYILSQNDLLRRSVVRDCGNYILFNTNMVLTPQDNEFPIHYWRFCSSLIDAENKGELLIRNKKLYDIAVFNKRDSVASLLKDIPTSMNVVHPSYFNGYALLSSSDKNFMDMIFIHSKVVDDDKLIEDLTMLNGIDTIKAKKCVAREICFPETILEKDQNQIIFMFKPNRNHVREFLNIFYQVWDKIIGEEERTDDILLITGSFGRGSSIGHDIYILSPSKFKNDIIYIMKILSNGILKCGDRSFSVVVLNTHIRIDIAFYEKEEIVTQKLHHYGPTSFNIWLRKKAVEAGYSLSQYHLKKIDKDGKINIIYPKSESELYKLLGLNSDPRESFWYI